MYSRMRRGMMLCLTSCLVLSVCLAPGTTEEATAADPLRLSDLRADELEPTDADDWVRGSFYLENDGGILKRNNPRDRHRTNSIGLSFAHHPAWANRLDEAMPELGLQANRTAAGYVLGQRMFTPTNLTVDELIEDDRPYAGYLFAGAFWQRTNGTQLDHLELDVGVVGPLALAEPAQKLAHDIFDGREPNGWDHQLDDEPTVQLNLRRKWKLALGELDLDGVALQGELIPQAGIAVGTVHRYVEAGATLRAGFNLPRDFGPGRLADIAAATARPRAGWGAYGFVRGGVRAVEHNIFLEGNTFNDSHRVDPEPILGEVEFGLAMQYRRADWSVEAMYSQTFFTEEFKKQRGGDAIASLTVSVTGRF